MTDFSKIFSEKIRQKRINSRGLFKNPLFYFGLVSVFLFSMIFLGCDSQASFAEKINSQTVFFNSYFDRNENLNKDGLFFSQADGAPMETPDLKLVQDNCLCGISTPRVLTPKVLGDVLGGSSQQRKDIVEYAVQPGDTTQSIAQSFGISVNTLLWANELTSSSAIKAGQTLVILPVDGVLYMVKSGDVLGDVSSKYKAKPDDVVAFNGLASENDIYIGDLLILPDAVMPKKATPLISTQAPLADNFFILPTSGKITQGLHFYNAVDTANKCGTSIYAAASGVVQRVKYGYNFGGGNFVTILHANGVVTYYGHLMTIFVKPGDAVNIGDRVALMGGGTGTAGDGLSTGCHLHFQVMGAKNPLTRYYVGTYVSLK